MDFASDGDLSKCIKLKAGELIPERKIIEIVK